MQFEIRTLTMRTKGAKIKRGRTFPCLHYSNIITAYATKKCVSIWNRH